MNIDELLVKIESNPTESRSLFLEAIEVLRQTSDNEDKVRSLRDQFQSLFLPNVSFWLNWLNDVTEQQQDIAVSKSLFSLALDNLPHCSIALSYIAFMTDSYDDDLTTVEELRSAFEHVLSVCGSDIVTGSELFKKYIEFELEEHEAVVEGLENCSPSEKAKQSDAVSRSKQRFVKLFHRQVALPLIGNEQCVAKFQQVLSELCVASDEKVIDPAGFQRKYQLGQAAREARLTYEVHLSSEAFQSTPEDSKVPSWLTYIQFEVKNKEMSRAQRLFERAVFDCPSSLLLWLDYTEFAFSVLKNHKLVLSISDRCLRELRQHTTLLWRTRLTSLEIVERTRLQQHHSSSEAVSDAVDGAIQRCLTSGGLESAQDIVDMLLLSCQVALRSVRETGSTTEEVRQSLVGRLSASFEYCLSCLNQWFPHWEGGYVSLFDLWASTENELVDLYEYNKVLREQQQLHAKAGSSSRHSAVRGSDVWERAVHLFPQSHLLFREYIRWTKSRISTVEEDEGDAGGSLGAASVEYCRRLLKRFVNVKYADYLEGDQLREWSIFEGQWGTSSEVYQSLVKSYPLLKKQTLTSLTATATFSDGNSTAEMNTSSSSRKRAKESASSEPGDSKDITGERKDEPLEERQKRARLNQADSESEAAAPTTNYDNVQSIEVVQVGNFPFSASEVEMRQHITDVVGSAAVVVQGVELMLSKSGTSRGIASVRLSCSSDNSGDAAASAMSAALKRLRGSEYAGRHLTATVTSGGAAGGHKAAAAVAPEDAGSLSAPHLTTVFVSRLQASETSEQLRDHFSQCGEVLSAKVSVDKKTGVSKGSGLVQFVDESGRTSALKLHKTNWNGHEILVAPSRFSLVSHQTAATAAATAVASSSSPAVSLKKLPSKVEGSSTPTIKPLSVVSFKPRNVVKPK